MFQSGLNQRKYILALLIVTALSLGGCSQKGAPAPTVAPSKPIVQAISVRPAAEHPSAAPNSSMVTAINATITLDKSALSQEFLYGADLQYSSFYDPKMDLYNQSMAIGHIPAKFRIDGNELELIADNKRLYPSEVNHPEQLLSRFTILSQTDTTLTVSEAHSEVFLSEIFEGTHTDTNGGLFNSTAKSPRDYWARSFDFDPNGNYILQQSSIVLNDGSIAEFMESIFPRDNLKPGSAFQIIKMDPGNPTGATKEDIAKNGPTSRYRLLPGEKIRHGEDTLAFAQHFDISNGTIDWYVTPNIPDEDLEPVKLAVEGWNRYFTEFSAIKREVVKFKGRLPEGIHLGDPRYNVINWDSRLVAGAAYETQATDPETGKQSHSLIYMPAAWLQIGYDYWNKGIFGDKIESVSPGTLGRQGGPASSARIACLRDVREGAALIASGRLSPDEVKIFGKQLLKQTLFHEVGHAMGLAHNFKGSLAFDRANPKTLFSYSIMDYNDFELERQAFEALNSSGGPDLEYDRQAIDAIYAQAADVKATDPVVATCNDAESDNEKGGVDPLCIRYDIEQDPPLAITTALNRIQAATLPQDISLAQSLSRIPGYVLDDASIQAIRTEDDLNAAVDKIATALKGSMQFYLWAGKASLARMVKLNLRSLLVFNAELKAPYDAQAMRERTFAGVQKSVGLLALPEAVQKSLASAEEAALTTLAKAPYFQSLSEDQRQKTNSAAKDALAKAMADFNTNTTTGLPMLRTAVLTALTFHPAVDFFFEKSTQRTDDYESAIIGLLADTIGTKTRTPLERQTAATALMTFGMHRNLAIKAVAALVKKLEEERAVATDNASLDAAESVLEILQGTAPKSSS